MVALQKTTGAWLSGVRVLLGGGNYGDSTDPFGPDSRQTLGILAFEAARTMSRLVSLHRSLSEAEVSKLRSTTMRSEGVAYLNSTDQFFLFRLACAEMVDELDRAVAAIARLSGRCHSLWPRGFHHIYADIKSGAGDLDRRIGLGFQPKVADKKIKKMEKFVSVVSNLYAEMETLAEMEASERKLQKWKSYSGPITAYGPLAPPLQSPPPGADEFLKKLTLQRRIVQKFQHESLWSESYEKVTELMGRTAITIFARICVVFAPLISELPRVISDKDGRFSFARNSSHFPVCPNYSSGPLERRVGGNIAVIRSSGPILRHPGKTDSLPWTTRVLEPPSTAVGGTGLALRYADVIDLAEKMLSSPDMLGEDTREELYSMLPIGLRAAVRTKLKNLRKMESGAVADDETMAAGWSDAAGRILGWLGPMARDTIKWNAERSCERQRFEAAGPRVLALQTLYFSDREKAEAAIVEVLVGLSCVCLYQHSSFFGKDGWD